MTDRIIHDPGKFKGEHVSVPHFWDVCLTSCADEDVYIGETQYSFIVLSPEDKAKFPDLTEYGVMLWERSDGFVCAEWFATKAEYDKAVSDYQSEAESENESED